MEQALIRSPHPKIRMLDKLRHSLPIKRAETVEVDTAMSIGSEGSRTLDACRGALTAIS